MTDNAKPATQPMMERDGYTSIKLAELTRLSGIAANEKELLKCLKREETEVERLRAEVERLKEWGSAHDRAFAAQCDREDALRARLSLAERVVELLDAAARVSDTQFICPIAFEASVRAARNYIRAYDAALKGEG